MTLPLTPVVDVTYTLEGVGAPRLGFDSGLIIGQSGVISPTVRVKVYESLDAMVTDGFSPSSPEYLAATKYFAATSSPSQVAIGRQASGETGVAAVQACRLANTDWYICYLIGASNTDHLEIAAYIEALTNNYSQYFLDTNSTAVRDNSPGNLFATLHGLNYTRTVGIYSTTTYAGAALMGYPMGATSDFANSAYTLFGKQLPGVTPSSLTTTQVNNIEGNKGNVYINRANFYNFVEKGSNFDGGWFDEIIYLDKLANQIQLNVADLLYTVPKVPQTEDGMAQIRTVVSAACQNLANIGFIAPGRWGGPSILTLNTGDYLPNGYLVMSDSITSQSQSDRDARIAPNIYVAVKLAGAIQTVLIRINVNR